MPIQKFCRIKKAGKSSDTTKTGDRQTVNLIPNLAGRQQTAASNIAKPPSLESKPQIQQPQMTRVSGLASQHSGSTSGSRPKLSFKEFDEDDSIGVTQRKLSAPPGNSKSHFSYWPKAFKVVGSQRPKSYEPPKYTIQKQPSTTTKSQNTEIYIISIGMIFAVAVIYLIYRLLAGWSTRPFCSGWEGKFALDFSEFKNCRSSERQVHRMSWTCNLQRWNNWGISALSPRKINLF